jgi:uncharacterized metal-binding protein YceD (DUF177 family)
MAILIIPPAPVSEPREQAEIPEMRLWNQLTPEHRRQLAQRWAELIQRIRRNTQMEKGSDEKR